MGQLLIAVNIDGYNRWKLEDDYYWLELGWDGCTSDLWMATMVGEELLGLT